MYFIGYFIKAVYYEKGKKSILFIQRKECFRAALKPSVPTAKF